MANLTNDRNIEIVSGQTYSVLAFANKFGFKIQDASVLTKSTGEIRPRIKFGDGDNFAFVVLSRSLRESGETVENFIENAIDRQIIRLKDFDHLDNNGNPNEWWCGCTAGEYVNVGGKDLSDLLKR